MKIALLTSNANKTYQGAGERARKARSGDIAVFSYKLQYVDNDVFLGKGLKISVFGQDEDGLFSFRRNGVVEAVSVSPDDKLNISFKIDDDDKEIFNNRISSEDKKFVKILKKDLYTLGTTTIYI